VNSLGAGEPEVAIAVSRFTIVRSARRRTAAAGPNTVAGSRASRVAIRPLKWTSPANAIVNRPAGEAAGLRAAADRPGDAEPDEDAAAAS
jgi:hypothetical protein